MTTRARQGAVRDKIDAAIRALEDAAHECGARERAFDHDGLAVALVRCDEARERLRRLVLDGSPQ